MTLTRKTLFLLALSLFVIAPLMQAAPADTEKPQIQAEESAEEPQIQAEADGLLPHCATAAKEADLLGLPEAQSMTTQSECWDNCEAIFDECVEDCTTYGCVSLCGMNAENCMDRC